jgi:hypothetical protein
VQSDYSTVADLRQWNVLNLSRSVAAAVVDVVVQQESKCMIGVHAPLPSALHADAGCRVQARTQTGQHQRQQLLATQTESFPKSM